MSPLFFVAVSPCRLFNLISLFAVKKGQMQDRMLQGLGLACFAALGLMLANWLFGLVSQLPLALKTKPHQLKDLRNPWNVGKREWIKQNFQLFHFALLGREGSGKSTTLQFIARHSGCPPEVMSQLEAAHGGTAHTQQFVPIEFDSVKFVDTTGLPDLSLSRSESLINFLHGKEPYLVPHTWEQNSGGRSRVPGDML